MVTNQCYLSMPFHGIIIYHISYSFIHLLYIYPSWIIFPLYIGSFFRNELFLSHLIAELHFLIQTLGHIFLDFIWLVLDHLFFQSFFETKLLANSSTNSYIFSEWFLDHQPLLGKLQLEELLKKNQSTAIEKKTEIERTTDSSYWNASSMSTRGKIWQEPLPIS